MNNIENIGKAECYGCGGCNLICPKKAITMTDVYEEGFLYPQINNDLCVECGLCKTVCPVLNQYKKNSKFPKAYAIKTEKTIADKSSTAGFFSVAADYIYSKGGWICGAIYDEKFNVYHTITKDKNIIDRMKKSKYVQSNLKNVYLEVKKILERGEIVLFSGTPCQIGGLRAFLKKDYEKLITIELLCHGVPAPGIWRKYLDENYIVDDIENIDFRYQGNSGFWSSQFMNIKYKDGRNQVLDNLDDSYYKAFKNNVFLRMSCNNCEYSQFPRVADISIGDWWGAIKVNKELIDGNKIGMLLVNNLKGLELLNAICFRLMYCEEISVSDAFVNNRLGKKIFMHPRRDKFFENIRRGKDYKSSFRECLYPNQYDVLIVGPVFNSNYGATITYYALYKAVEKLGYRVAATCEPYEQYTYQTSSFTQNKVNLAPAKKSWEFKDYNWMTDTFLLGSDQVWNYTLFWSDKYFLKFVHSDKKRIAYGSSFGMNYLTMYDKNQDKYPEFNKLLKRFDNIGIREDAGVEICEREFSVNALHVLDPVFLLEQKDYDAIANEAKEKHEGKYLTSYFLSALEQFNKLLQYVSDYLDLPMWNMLSGDPNVYNTQKDKIIGNICENLSMEEWINNIRNAEFVVTDSFHCLCFCIIYKKKFVIIQKAWGLSRITSLLNMLGLSERRIERFEDILEKTYLLEDEIDYDNVYSLLNCKKNESMSYLVESLKQEKKVYECYKSTTDDLTNIDMQIKSTNYLLNYFDLLKIVAKNYVILGCSYGNNLSIDLYNSVSKNILDIVQENNNSFEEWKKDENSNYIDNDSRNFKAIGSGSDNSRTTGIKLKPECLEDLIYSERQVYTVSFDWKTTANTGKFKLQLGGGPWDDLTDYIVISSDKQSGHYENIYLTSANIKKFTAGELQVRADKLFGNVEISNLKLEKSNRATRSYLESEMVAERKIDFHGFALIADIENNFMDLSAASFGKVKYKLHDTSFLIEQQNSGFRECNPNSEIYITNHYRKYIYPLENEGLYLLLYSKDLHQVVDILYINSEGNIIHR